MITECLLKRVCNLELDDVVIYSGIRIKVASMNDIEIVFDSVKLLIKVSTNPNG